MAFLRQAKTEDEIKKLNVTAVKKAYNDLAADYNRIIDCGYLYCHKCNTFLSRDIFYSSNDYASGYFPICKKCLLEMVEQRKKKNDPPNETKESVKRVLQLMDLPYIDELYESSVKTVANEVNEKNRKSPFLQYIVPIKSLSQYKGKTWKDSEFEPGVYTDEEEVKINARTIKNAKKRFGGGYSNEDYMFLENEYQDWITRYECDSKSQEEAFQRLSFKKLEIWNASKKGLPTKDLDKTYQDWLNTANVTPRQNVLNPLNSMQTLGTLIQKYEETRPLPEIDPELQDIDKIGLYIDAFFKGHTCKMLGIKNTFSHIYERVMKKFEVTPPEYDEESQSEVMFEKIFGKRDE